MGLTVQSPSFTSNVDMINLTKKAARKLKWVAGSLPEDYSAHIIQIPIYRKGIPGGNIVTLHIDNYNAGVLDVSMKNEGKFTAKQIADFVTRMMRQV